MKTRRWIVITVLVLALIMPVSPVRAAPSASITITPPLPNPAPVGSEVSFALVITVTDINPGVAGADIHVGYYYDKLLAPPISPNNVVEPLPDFFGESIVNINENLPDCPGFVTIPEISLSCIHLVVEGPVQVTHSGAVARFHFHIIAEGKVCFEVLTSALVDKDGFPISHTRGDPQCATIDNIPAAKGTVLRQGTPANPNPGGGTLACSEVKIIPSISGPVFTIDESVLPNFEFRLTNPSAGVYTIHAGYSGYLASEARTTIPPSKDVGTTTLCGGDVNADRVINILDIGLIIGKFGACNLNVGSSNPTACRSASIADDPRDINDDGCVNIRDLAIAAGNWGRTGPTLWDTTQCDP